MEATNQNVKFSGLNVINSENGVPLVCSQCVWPFLIYIPYFLLVYQLMFRRHTESSRELEWAPHLFLPSSIPNLDRHSSDSTLSFSTGRDKWCRPCLFLSEAAVQTVNYPVMCSGSGRFFKELRPDLFATVMLRDNNRLSKRNGKRKKRFWVCESSSTMQLSDTQRCFHCQTVDLSCSAEMIWGLWNQIDIRSEGFSQVLITLGWFWCVCRTNQELARLQSLQQQAHQQEGAPQQEEEAARCRRQEKWHPKPRQRSDWPWWCQGELLVDCLCC